MADKKETKPKKQVKDENRKPEGQPIVCFAPIGANALKIEIRNGTPKDINSDIIELNGKIEIENFGTHACEVKNGRVFRTQEGRMAKLGEVGDSDLPWLQEKKKEAIKKAKAENTKPKSQAGRNKQAKGTSKESESDRG